MDVSSPAKTLEYGSEGKVAAGVSDANATVLGLGLGLQSRVQENSDATVSVLGGLRDGVAENAGHCAPRHRAVIGDKSKVSLDEIRVSVEEEKVGEEDVTVCSSGEELVKTRVEESEVKEIRVEIVLGENESGRRVGRVGLSGPENGVAAAADGSRNLSVGEGDDSEVSRDGTVGKEEEEEEGEEEEKKEEEDESGDHQEQFAVGDFVWGKIKSHPWWPGQIYDPSEASDYAGRFRRRDRLLVAYFGDGTFAWCYASQLKPFGKEFTRLYKQSSSRSFVNAVEKALDKFGRCVESQMTCSCVEARPKLVKPFTLNAGIKEGVTVPEGMIAEHSITGFQPVDFLAGLKYVAQLVSMSNALERTLLKSRLSAFYHAQGYGDLPVYYDPQGITDSEENGDVHLSERTEVEGRTDGLSKVDGGESLTSGVTSQKGNDPSLKGPDIAEDKLLQRKKQRSMAELMAGGTDSDFENGSHGGVGGVKEPVKSTSASNKRKKFEQASPSQEGKNEMKQAIQSGKHEADRCATLSVAVEDDKPCDDENQDDGVDEGNLLSSLRKRKKSKYLSPPYTMLNSKTSNSSKDAEGEAEVEATPKLLKISESGEGTKKAAAKLTGAPPIIKCSGETFQKKPFKKIDAEEKTAQTSSPRTPKLKEKILAIEKYNVAPEEMLSHLSSAAVNPLFLGEDVSSNSIKAFFEKFRNSLYVRGSDYNTYKGRKKRKFSPINDADGTHKSEGKSGQEYGGRKSSKGSGGGGADNRGQEVSSGGKKASSVTESKNIVPPGNKDPEGTKDTQGKAGHKKRKLGVKENSDASRKRTGERASEKVGTLDSANGHSHTETNHKEVNGGGPAASALLLTFGQGATFPSKEDLITIFDQFGELNKSETEVLVDLGCARVVFMRSSDAEKAFNSSDKISALRTLVVSYRLRYLSAPSRASKVDTDGAQNQAIASMPEGGKDGAPVGFGSPVPGPGSGTDPTPTSSPTTLLVIKKNLETMMSTLTESGEGQKGSEEKLSPEVRANLIGEISGLLKKVTKLIDCSSQA